MAQTAEKLELYEVPGGGIGEFVKSDKEIEALEKQEAEQEFGNEGLAHFQRTAGKMAGYGRFGDDSVAHIQTGEIVIPKVLIDNNPRLKAQIFSELQAAGVENPEQYVVGTGANSINPETGLMEFGFLKKIFKGIGKAFKKVGKILKKTAHVILPVVGSIFLGPIGAGLGSGIATLIQGGKLKDAFKSGIISFATANLFQAGADTFGPSGSGSFFDNLGKSVAGSGAQFSQGMSKIFGGAGAGAAGAGTAGTAGSAKSALDEAVASFTSTSDAAANILGPRALPAGAVTGPSMQQITARLPGLSGSLPSSTVPAASGSILTPDITQLSNANVAHQLAGNNLINPYSAAGEAALAANPNPIPMPRDFITSRYHAGSMLPPDLSNLPATGVFPELADVSNLSAAGADGTRTFTDAIVKDAGKGAGTAAADGKEVRGVFETLADKDKNWFGKEGKLAEIFTPQTFYGEDAKIGMLRRFGPGAAVGIGALYAGGGFEVPPMEPIGLVGGETGQDYIDKDPAKYLVHDIGTRYLNPETGEYETKPQRPTLVSQMLKREQADRLRQQQIRNLNPQLQRQNAAGGGEIYPRRVGGIMPDEGVPNEDSVRAMLMPGEFVLTTDAVRGAGEGDLEQGINNMYDVMRNLERRGRAYA